MTTFEDRSGHAVDATDRKPKSAVRRKPARKTGRRRAADHGKNFPERAMADRRASARRETDPWIGFLPLVD